MAEPSDSSLEALLREARAEFGRGLPGRISELEATVARGEWPRARRAAHQLRGSAGIYGFSALGAAAAALEEVLIASASSPDAGTLADIRTRLDELSIEANRASLEIR